MRTEERILRQIDNLIYQNGTLAGDAGVPFYGYKTLISETVKDIELLSGK